jgi:hypothetical protein
MKKTVLIGIAILLVSAMRPTDDFVTILSKKLEAYYQIHPHEQIHVVFNQEKYSPADTAFFQVYFLDNSQLGLKKKRILTLGLFDSNGNLIEKINFNVSDNRGGNQIVIPENTLSGNYMCALIDYETSDINNKPLFLKEILIVNKNQFKIYKNQPDFEYAFEGGHFIVGVENRLIVRSKWVGKAKVINGKNQEITEFEIGKSGLANVIINPNEGEVYSIKVEGMYNPQPLQKAKEDGIAIRVVDEFNAIEPVTISLCVPENSNLRKKEIYLVQTLNGNIAYSCPIQFDTHGKFFVKLSPERIKNGLNLFSVLQNDGVVLTERVLFRNNPILEATISPIQRSINQREKIEVDFSLKDKIGNPMQGSFSISVLKKEFSNESDQTFSEDFYSRNLLASANNNSLTYSYDRKTKTSIINDLLAFQDFKLVPWQDIFDVRSKLKQPATLKIRGQAIFKNGQKPVPDSTLLIGYLQKSMVGYETYTTKDGYFEMPFLFDFWGKDELFYSLEFNGKDLNDECEIIVVNGNYKIKSIHNVTETDTIDAYANFSLKKKLVHKSYLYFSAKENESNNIQKLNNLFEEEAMGSDFTVNVQDYIVFPTMEDLIREVVPFLQHRKRGNSTTVRLLLNKNNSYVAPKGNPLFLIDGVLTKNKEFFLNLKPVDVLQIKLINNLNKLSQLGALGKNGVVLVETKRSAISRSSLNNTVINLQGLSKPVIPFSSETPKEGSSRIPDIRSRLLWSSFNEVDRWGKSKVSFYSSDETGTYTISIKGITNSGEPFEANQTVDVSFKSDRK